MDSEGNVHHTHLAGYTQASVEEGQESKPKPTKIRVYIYVHKKGSGGYLPGNCQCGACVHARIRTQLMSVVHATRVGTTKLTKVQPVTGSSFPMETN